MAAERLIISPKNIRRSKHIDSHSTGMIRFPLQVSDTNQADQKHSVRISGYNFQNKSYSLAFSLLVLSIAL